MFIYLVILGFYVYVSTYYCLCECWGALAGHGLVWSGLATAVAGIGGAM